MQHAGAISLDLVYWMCKASSATNMGIVAGKCCPLPTGNYRDAVFEVLRVEKIVHYLIGLVLITHPHLQEETLG